MGKEVCAIWILDETTNKKLEELRKVLETFSIEYNPLYGHITFASFMDVDVDEILQYTKKFSQGKKSFDINCSALGFLTTNCIACIPSTSGNLLKYYEEYHKEFDSYCNTWTKADTGLWMPHISLYHSETEDLSPIIGEMSKKFIQFKGKVVRMELSVVNENDFDIVYSHNLE
ncbi:hypothetical protein [Haloimpatiens massiliensis]|uniref:hypothetical protein n=1 Tax=Haloimpatiens massiliensis TaxID=1658110 RepID=UPI000C85ED6B|nr:hypothetical protein [Haloimpatiens massiliensis]